MKRGLLNLGSLVFYILGIILTFVWYDWKLLIIILLLLWGSNLAVISGHLEPLKDLVKKLSQAVFKK